MKILEWKDKFTGEDMFDYHTGTITGDNIFDTTKTGMSYYNQLLPGSKDEEYYKKEKNIYGKIVNLTPQQYFEACVEYAFPTSSVEKLKQQRGADKYSLDKIETVIKNDVQLPITVINAADKTQEGLHRMYVVGEMFGWNNKKYPVLFVDYFDYDRQRRWEEQHRIYEIQRDIEDCVKEAGRYKFSSLEEFEEELQWKINSKFKYYSEFEDYEDIPFEFNVDEDEAVVTVLGVPYTFDVSLIKIVEDEEDTDNLDLSDEDLDNLLIDDDFLNSLLNK